MPISAGKGVDASLMDLDELNRHFLDTQPFLSSDHEPLRSLNNDDLRFLFRCVEVWRWQFFIKNPRLWVPTASS